MADSEEQFQDLLAHLIVRVDKILSEQGKMPPLSLMLRPNGEVEVSIGVVDDTEQMAAVLNAMQAALASVVLQQEIDATCIAYPNYQDQTIVALLENNENYCATVSIPVLTDSSIKLDTGNIQIDDGGVYIFPLTGGT